MFAYRAEVCFNTIYFSSFRDFFSEIQITGSQFVEKGDRIVLQCNATGEYYPPDEMDWFRNGERLSSQRHRGVRISKQYSISKRTFTSVLVINRANMDDDGTYVCRSSNMQITSTKVHVLNGKSLFQDSK